MSRSIVVLTGIFWALFLAPGLALGLGWLPGLPRARALAGPPEGAGLLARVAYGYAASFLLLSPLSLLGYATSAPLWLFSAGLCGVIGWGLVGLVWHGRVQAGQRLLAFVRREPPVPYLILLGLLWLQGRIGGWLDGDATFHLGRVRVLLEHGFTNRDIYLADYHFQHAYHSNLLFPVYASLAQLTRQDPLVTWVHSEMWAKLLVAAGHYVLALSLTKQRSVAYLLAIGIVTLNAGETYTLYPNTLCVGWLLPVLLGLGLSCVSGETRRARSVGVPIGGLMFVLVQVHGLYAIYAGLILGPWLVGSLLWPRAGRGRWVSGAALVGLALAVPFLLVSRFGFRTDVALVTAPEDAEPAEVQPAPRAGITSAAPTRVAVPDALAAGGGHLEKVLDAAESGRLIFKAEHMGGRQTVTFGCLALALAIGLYRTRRLPLIAALTAALWLMAILFTELGATWGAKLLQGPFIVARLSTVLTSLLVFGVCAVLAWPLARLQRGRGIALSLLCVGVTWAASKQLGHAPVSFREHVQTALAPETERRGLLQRMIARRALLAAHIPAGTTVLTTARFARQVVMLRDCYVLAADRGHTGIVGIDKRRRDLAFLNAAQVPWEERARLLAHYQLRYVTFESRWRRRYAWAREHGTLLGSAAGQDVIELRLP
ncbi:MAG: hypothetical protein ABW321_18095 [Polyangiales bacterium]